jgi:hypothetical protein
MKIKFVYHKPMPQMPGEARRIIFDETVNGYEYRSFMVMLPCGHITMLDNRWQVVNLDTDYPTVSPSIQCIEGGSSCWHGTLTEGELKPAVLN